MRTTLAAFVIGLLCASTVQAQLTPLATPDGAAGSLAIRQDARLLGVLLAEGEEVPVSPEPARRYWLHVAAGAVALDGERLAAGDALGLQAETAARTLRGRTVKNSG